MPAFDAVNNSNVRRRPRAFPQLMVLAAALALPAAADEVTKWSELSAQAALDSGLANNPIFQTRVDAMAHVAMHDALNGIQRRYAAYAWSVPVQAGASPEAAVAAAAHDVLVDQYTQLTGFGITSQKGALDVAYANSLAAIPNGSAKSAGIAIGQAAALAILARRATDGWNTQTVLDFAYPQGTEPGQYRFTPPNTFVFLPQWGSVRPFVLRDSQQFWPNRPYPINSNRYTDDYNEVRRLGGDGVNTPSARTRDQTEIALFWLEGSPLQWNRIARAVSAARRLTLWENARLFALLNLALADGYIGTFQAKYEFNFWRPITAIRLGESDGNPNTAGDPNWSPLVDTPPIPDHDSGHAVEGGAGAQVLERFFGSDRQRFRVCSTSLPAGSRCTDPTPVMRTFTTFSQAADENGVSRIYVGYHFRNAVTEGIQHGRKIGNRAFNRYLRPVQ